MKTVYLQIWDCSNGRSRVGVEALADDLRAAESDCRALVQGGGEHAWCDLIRLDNEGYHFIKTFRPMSAKPDDESAVEYV